MLDPGRQFTFALLGYVGYRKVRKVRPPEKAIAEAQNIKHALTNRGD